MKGEPDSAGKETEVWGMFQAREMGSHSVFGDRGQYRSCKTKKGLEGHVQLIGHDLGASAVF